MDIGLGKENGTVSNSERDFNEESQDINYDIQQISIHASDNIKNRWNRKDSRHDRDRQEIYRVYEFQLVRSETLF